MLRNTRQRMNQRKKEISVQNHLEKQPQTDLNVFQGFASEKQGSLSSGMLKCVYISSSFALISLGTLGYEESKQRNGLHAHDKQSKVENHLQYEKESFSTGRKRRRSLSSSVDEEMETSSVTGKPKRRPPSQSTLSLSTVPNRGLKLMTLTICDAIQGHGSTTYSQLAQDLALVLGIPLPASSELKNDPSMAILEKNIRRRVYDCLNVLIAIGLIEKTEGGRTLKWVGKMNFSSEQDQSPSSSPSVNSCRDNFSGISSFQKSFKNDQLLSQLHQKRRMIEEKRENLELLKRQECAFQKLIDRNRKLPQHCYDRDSKIELPFILVRTPPSSEIFLETTEDQTMMKFKFTQVFYLHGDAEVVTRLETNQSNFSKTSPELRGMTDNYTMKQQLEQVEDWLPDDKENIPYFISKDYTVST